MFSKIYKILKESITAVTRVNQWEIITKDLFKQKMPNYQHLDYEGYTESCPKFSKGQLVVVKYHSRWKHLHKEVGIVLKVHNYEGKKGSLDVHFYDLLVGDEKITLIERFLDEFINEEEE